MVSGFRLRESPYVIYLLLVLLLKNRTIAYLARKNYSGYADIFYIRPYGPFDIPKYAIQAPYMWTLKE